MQSATFSEAARAGAACVVQSWRRAWGGLAGAVVLVALAVALAHEAWAPLVLLGAWLWLCQAQAACYRIALGDAPPAFAGARATADVTRLIAVGILESVLVAIMAALLTVALCALAFGVASAGPGFSAADPATWRAAMGGRGGGVLGVAGVAALAAIVWLKARLALAPAATVALGKVQVLSAWPLTRGQVLPVLAALVVAAAPLVVLACLIHLALPRAPIGPGERLLLGLALGLALGGLTLPLQAGLMTYLYRRTGPPKPA